MNEAVAALFVLQALEDLRKKKGTLLCVIGARNRKEKRGAGE